MNQNNDKISIMRDEPIASALMKLGIPTMVGMLISALYNAIDAYFVGGLGLSQMGAVSVVFPIVQIIIGLGMMFGAGASSYISRSLGKEITKRQTGRLLPRFFPVFWWALLSSSGLCCFLILYLPRWAQQKQFYPMREPMPEFM